ncbi:enolase-phosphatase E1 [Drosophila grimshawi]|uniref:Enolase-phosphatase E1 n=1 Tax=Drosophila grimshawi TaxID=7222 RepID=ENOPH_DROGR|nr:enolase-phosphatase E1 [Drosophila grimshawi]B4JSP3.1 RecName: Full=Enolase-phosphatase E1; AltName: Full=2,3-diketo-5-methylthio-1-phosphopentane phosphatase [Drosophila grimshawi]EDV94783.1 GH22720 [Drosophila grimshawi]
MAQAESSTEVVLVDIEGTTTSISFVHDVLFPYAKENAKDYLLETWQTDETKLIVKELQQLPHYTEYAANLATQPTLDAEAISRFVRYLIERDLKVTPLKTLQGLIWAKGYADGQLRGHVYEDVAGAFGKWHQDGIRIAVYSSGSVAAQKLIFQHSIAGDLLPHLSAHFDTHIGHKQQSESYTKIAESLQVQPQHVLFLTDVPQEAAAARAAGMLTTLLERPGNAPLSEEERKKFSSVADFTGIVV